MKYCKNCKTKKNRSEFHKDKTSSDGLCYRCKECKISYISKRMLNPEIREKNRESSKKRRLNEELRKKDNLQKNIRRYERDYGMSKKDAETLIKNRNANCKICGEIKFLVVDHCHESGEIRGLICSPCNSILGYSRDNTKTLKNAISYLEEFYGTR